MSANVQKINLPNVRRDIRKNFVIIHKNRKTATFKTRRRAKSNVRRDKEPPAQLGGGFDEKKSYSVGLSLFQPDRAKTFEGRKGGADRAFCSEVDFGVLEFVGEGVFRVNRD